MLDLLSVEHLPTASLPISQRCESRTHVSGGIGCAESDMRQNETIQSGLRMRLVIPERFPYLYNDWCVVDIVI